MCSIGVIEEQKEVAEKSTCEENTENFPKLRKN